MSPVGQPAAGPRIFESVIKVAVGDPPHRRARDIADGITYAAILLHDEYGYSADDVRRVLDDADDAVADIEADRRG